MADPPLLNAAGLQAPRALRAIAGLESCEGCEGVVGVSEIPGSAASEERHDLLLAALGVSP